MSKVQNVLTKMILSTDPNRVADAAAIQCLKIIETRRVQTAACDGIVILVNPDYIDTLTDEQIMALMVHEVMHPRLDHNERFRASGWLDHDRANMSMDREINPIVEAAGYVLPPDGCWPEQIGMPRGLPWESYYANEHTAPPTPDQPEQGEADDEGQQGKGEPQQGQGSGGQAQPADDSSDDDGDSDHSQQGDGQSAGSSGSSTDGDANDQDDQSHGQSGQGSTDNDDDQSSDDAQGQGEDESEADIESGVHATGDLAAEFDPDLADATDQQLADLAREVADAMDHAANNEGAIGSTPQGGTSKGDSSSATVALEARSELIEVNSDTRWQDVVIEQIEQRVGGEPFADWSTPSRRSQSVGFYMPRLRQTQAVKVALVLDVSGSCVEYFSHWQRLAREMAEAITDITEMEIIYHNTQVTSTQQWQRASGEEITLLTTGGGGTDHRSALAKADEAQADIIIMFTDAMTCWPTEPPTTPCVTILIPGSYCQCPFGTNIKIGRV